MGLSPSGHEGEPEGDHPDWTPARRRGASVPDSPGREGEAVRLYVSAKRWELIRGWGKETAKKLQLKEDDIDRIIHEYRAERKKKK